jgi:vancomycin resistance protein YoaR
MWIPDLSKNKNLWKKTPIITILLYPMGAICIVAAIVAVISYYRYTNKHIPPHTYINSIDVGNLTYEEAQFKLRRELPFLPESSVTVDVEGLQVSSSSAELDIHYDIDQTLESIKHRTTTGKLRWQSWWRVASLLQPVHEVTPIVYSEDKLKQLIDELNQKVAYPGEDPQAILKIGGNANTLSISKGKFGREVDTSKTIQLIKDTDPTKATTITAAVASPGGELNDDQVEKSKARAEKYIGKSIKFSGSNNIYSINDKQMVDFLVLPDGYNNQKIDDLLAKWKDAIDRKPQNPTFEYEKDSLKVTKFEPPREGLALNIKETQDQVLQQLKRIESSDETKELTDEQKADAEKEIDLKITTTAPEKSLGATNDLGIKELIGFGDSHYDHSIPNRIHNVAITTQRISDVIVPPGKEFQFNKTLGDVSAATGFRSAYVIKNGQTSLGDGGGVCQVSTTLFRSVLDAGLKVTRRLPHSYRVSYYELDTKPGVDATVYAGETDFRFINDTDHHILIHAEADSKNLYMFVDIYGTSDGRTAEIIDHKTWNARPALPAEYIPDPTLPAGTLKQVDWAAPGINASFVNVIKDKDGKIIREDKYVSNYRPWSAKYLQGTGG